VAVSLEVSASEYLLGASDLNSDKFNEKAFKRVSSLMLSGISNIARFAGRF
jgi:hypothetical protein